MEKRSVQVNCRMAADSADRLKALADSAGLPLGAFIEKLLDCYQPDSTVIAGSDGWQSVADDLGNRVLALESRLGALEAERAVTTGAVEEKGLSVALVPVDSDDPAYSSIQHESTVDQAQKIDQQIVALRKEGKGIKAIEKALHVGQARVSKVIKAAGLK
jgi:hypothetical protein